MKEPYYTIGSMAGPTLRNLDTMRVARGWRPDPIPTRRERAMRYAIGVLALIVVCCIVGGELARVL